MRYDSIVGSRCYAIASCDHLNITMQEVYNPRGHLDLGISTFLASHTIRYKVSPPSLILSLNHSPHMASLPADRASMDETRSFLGHGHEDTPVENVGPFNPYTPSTESSRPAYNEPATPVKETRTHRLSLRVVFSTVIVFVGTAGIASALLGWLIIHKTQPTITKVWQGGAFLLDEGERTEGGLRSGRLLGLTISSAAVSPYLQISTSIFIHIDLYSQRCYHSPLQ